MNQQLFIANHAAATLEGLKASSLVCLKTLECELEPELLERLESLGVSSLRITNRLSCPLILFYRKDLLQAVLDDELSRKILKKVGYEKFDTASALATLEERFRNVLCPDEIGVFLGYPLRDVESYIENGGKGALYSGYWKVYHDLESAVELEHCFNCAREKMTNAIRLGMSLEEALTA